MSSSAFGLNGPNEPANSNPSAQNGGIGGSGISGIGSQNTTRNGYSVGNFNLSSGGDWAAGGGATATSNAGNTSTPSDDGSTPLVVRGIRPSSQDSGSSTGTDSSGASGGSAAPGGAGGGMNGGSGVLGTSDQFRGYQDNPLNSYAQVAYHWRFYANGEADSAQAGQGVTIAETGVTGFNIKEVSFQTHMAPSARTRNAQLSDIEVTVVEAMGVSFLDGLMQAQIASGVQKNFQKNYYFLELAFKGYTEQGAQVNQITNQMASKGKWTWKCVIVDIATQLHNGGAIYTLKMLVHHDVAVTQPEILRTLDSYRIEADTVGEFFQTFKTKLNESYKRHYQDQQVTYDFKFHASNGLPSPESFKLKSIDSQDVDYRRADSMTEGTRDKWVGTPMVSSAITDIVETVVSVSREGQSLMIWGDKDKDPNIQPDGSYRVSIKYQCYPEVKWGQYNDVTGHYRKTITFHIKPFLTQKTVMDSSENAKNSAQNLQEAKKRMAKKYEYVFTGLNTEVINFDIKFNTAWSAALPRIAGHAYWTDNVQQHARYDFKGEEEKQKFKSGQQNYQNAAAQQFSGTNNLVSGLIGAATGNNNFAQTALSQIGALSGAFNGQAAAQTIGQQGVQNALNGLFGNSTGATTAPATTSFQNLAQTFTGLTTPLQTAATTGSTPSATPAFLKAAQSWMPQVGSILSGQSGLSSVTNASGGAGGSASGGQYVEDILGSFTAAQMMSIVSTVQNAQGARRAAGTGVASQRSNRGRAIYGALLDQTYDNNALQNIELTIRGDPYWLGGVYDEVMFGDSAADPYAPNPTSGDICFLLVFRYPLGLDENGQPRFTNQEAFTGLYQVHTIRHSFADGKFTQVLMANRLQKVSTTDALKEDAGSLSTGQATSTPMTANTTGTIGNTTVSGLPTLTNTTLPGTSGVPTNTGPTTIDGSGVGSIGTPNRGMPSFTAPGVGLPTGTITLGTQNRSA